MRNIFIVSCFIFPLLGISTSVIAEPTKTEEYKKKPKNIIYFIGDGMGPAYTSAYRYYLTPPNETVKETVFDELFVGMSSTYPEDHSDSDGNHNDSTHIYNNVVTDSAASATALSSGIKSYNGAIGLDNDMSRVETLFELAKRQKMKTGIVVTSQVNHATPASFMAHAERRSHYDEIADQFVDNQISEQFIVDVILGGGTQYFIRDDRNLVSEMKAKGYSYIDNLSNLDQLKSAPALGLFAEKGLPYAIDTDSPNRLTLMTQKALSLLEDSPEGFVLLVEGSQIDWCGHDNDIACALAEVDDFANAMKVAQAFAKERGDTLIVGTADHNTGGLSMGSDGTYFWDVNTIRQISASLPVIAQTIIDNDEISKTIHKLTGMTLRPNEYETLKAAKAEGIKPLHKAVRVLINRRTFTGWTSLGHTAVDVQVFAYGPFSALFYGYLDNTEIATTLHSLIKDPTK